jgi:hypothetical protein
MCRQRRIFLSLQGATERRPTLLRPKESKTIKPVLKITLKRPKLSANPRINPPSEHSFIQRCLFVGKKLMVHLLLLTVLLWIIWMMAICTRPLLIIRRGILSFRKGKFGMYSYSRSGGSRSSMI